MHFGVIKNGLIFINYVSIGLIHEASCEAEMKTATCEITNTSGVYPIYGTISLTQTVSVIITACQRSPQC